MRRRLALLALGLCASAQAAGPPPALDDVIDHEMPASGAPGLAYAVVADGEVSAEGARGVVAIGGEERVTPDTAFQIGSITKSFTALAVMQLVEAGKVELDTEVSHYLDAFAGGPAGSITIRQLLSHTSGFSTLQGNTSDAETRGDRREDTRREDTRRLAQLSPAHAPGGHWEYSNLNYLILGRLIEVVSGQDYETYIETRILEPAGMEHSFVAYGEAPEAIAAGHTPWFGGKRSIALSPTYRGTPQGGLYASAGDLALYMQIMLNGEDDILSARAKAAMLRPASDASPFYGLGWFINAEDGSVWHAGATVGFETLATMVPAERKGVVVLVNAGSGLGFGETTALRSAVTASAIGLDYDGEGSRWSQKALFIALALMPPLYLLSMIWAWRERDAVRAKSGAFGRFSLWFPLVTTLAAAWVMLSLVPGLMGAPIGTVRRFQPDLGLVLIAASVTGVLWSVFRLGVAYSGRSRRS